MAFSKPVGGDRMNLIAGNCKPWKPNSSYTSAGPAKGDLVKQDTSGNDLVNICSNGDVPLGIVLSLNNGNGTLSIWEFHQCDVLLEYTGTFAIGDKIVANGTSGTIAVGGNTRSQVIHNNSTGIGTVVERDSVVVGLATVRFQ